MRFVTSKEKIPSIKFRYHMEFNTWNLTVVKLILNLN